MRTFVHLLTVVLLIPTGSLLAQTAVVTLSDGRTLRGDVDPQTDEQHLWLKTVHQNLTLRSRFDWSQVTHIHYPDAGLPNRPRLQGVDGLDAKQPLLAGPESWPLTRLAQDPRAVRTLRIEAHFANWDRDPEVDGVRVRVVPEDWYGQPVPVRAAIDFRLVGWRQRNVGGQRVSRERPFVRLAEWSRRTDPHEFGPEGTVFELPFRNRPNFQLATVQLEARLGIAGVGVFETKRQVPW